MKKIEGARDFVVRELKALRTDDLKARLLLAEESLTLTPRQRASLCVGSRLDYSELIRVPDEQINWSFLRQNGVEKLHIIAARISVKSLVSRGATVKSLATCGIDSLDLAAHEWLVNGIVAEWGVDTAASLFFRSADDAVALVATAAAVKLKLKTIDFVRLCAGHAEQLRTIIQTVGVAGFTGLDAQQLCESSLRLEVHA